MFSAPALHGRGAAHEQVLDQRRLLAANGPAASAGLQPGDILVAINGKATSEGRNAMYRIALMAPGDPLELVIYRERRRLVLHGMVGQRPEG